MSIETRRVDRDTPPRRPRSGSIERTPGVCGGAACVAGTRIPVWQLIEARDLGATDTQLLIDYPSLDPVKLTDAWDYARDHPSEIDADLRRNGAA